MTRLRKMAAGIMCLIMLAAFVPEGVTFADSNQDYNWYYSLDLKVHGRDNSQSKDTKAIVYKRYDSSTIYTLINITDDLSKNELYEKTVYTDIAPWEIEEIGVTCGNDDALCVYYFTLTASFQKSGYSNASVEVVSQKASKAKLSPYYGWVGGKAADGHPSTIMVETYTAASKLTSNAGVDSIGYTLSGTTVLDVKDTSGTLDLYWDGLISDQYSRQYNCFMVTGAPTVKISASANGYNTKQVFELSNIVSATGLKVTETSSADSLDKASNPGVGFSVSKAKLLEFMNNEEINLITITTKFTFPRGRLSIYNVDYDGNYITVDDEDRFVIEKTHTIIRNAFTIGEPEYSDNFSLPAEEDNYYYSNNYMFKYSGNAGYGTSNGKISVTVPIKLDEQNHNNLDTTIHPSYMGYDALFSVGARTLECDSVRLKIGKQDLYVDAENKDVTIDAKGRAVYNFTIPEGYDSNDVGLSLVLEGAHISVPVSVTLRNGSLIENTVDFWLYDYDANGKNDTFGDITVLNAKYKVDRLDPTVEVSEIDGGGKFGEWNNKMTVNIQPSETLFDLYDVTYLPEQNPDLIKLNGKDTGIYASGSKLFTQPQVRYKLKKLLTDSDGNITSTKNYERISYILADGEANTGATQQSILIASGGDPLALTIALRDAEEGKYSLQIIGKDRANNVMFYETDGDFWLDNKPPVISMTISEPQVTVDKKLTQEYVFGITDLSKSGILYYYIDTVGNGPTHEYTAGATAGVDETTGVMETLYDQWVFIKQTDNDASTTDGSALISISPGEEFSGKLYYLAVDGSGNTTTTKTASINLSNVSLDCEIDWTEIGSKTDYEITLDNAAGTSVSYRWLDSNKNEVTKSAEYTGSVLASDSWEKNSAWDGYYYFEYTVTAVSGASTSSQAAFFFDNSAPTIAITDANAGEYTEDHSIKVSISDNSVISEARAQYFTADGNAVSDEFSLIEAGANGAYAISENLLFGSDDEIVSGVYRLKVYACDEHGNESETESGLIHIRNDAPTVTLDVKADYEYGEGEDALPMVGKDGEYTVTVSMSEDFDNPGMAIEINEKQYAYYRVTNGSQSNPGAWTFMGEMKANETENKFEGEFTLTNPKELVEGANVIMIETVIVTDGRTVYPNDNVKTVGNKSARIGCSSFTIYYDETAPRYYLALEDKRTNGNMVGKLRIYDKYASTFTVESDNEAITAELIEGDVDLPEEEEGRIYAYSDSVMPYMAMYTVTVTENTSGSITIVDEAGNKSTVPVKVEKIDRVGPDANMTSYEYRQSGERTDVYATVEISTMRRNTPIWTAIPADEIDNVLASGTIDDSYFEECGVIISAEAVREDDTKVDSEINAEYEVRLAGATGDYYLALRAEDGLGNVSDTVFDEILTIVDATPTMKLVSVTPKEAGSRALAKLETNVPLFVTVPDVDPNSLDPDSVELENLRIAESYVGKYSTDYSWIVTDNGEYVFYVVDELRRSSKVVVEIPEEFVTFGHELNEPIVTKYQRSETYTWYPNELISSSEKQLSDDEYMAGTAIYTYPDDDTFTETVPLIKIEPVPLDDGTETYLMPLSGDFDDDSYYDGMFFRSDLSTACEFGYTEMVYQIESVLDDEGDPLEQFTRNVDIYVTTAERFQYGASDWELVNVFIDKVDNTWPVSTTVYNPIANDPYSGSYSYTMDDVTVDIYFDDPQTGLTDIDIIGWGYITDIATYEVTEGDIYLTIPLVDDDGNGIDYSTTPYTFENEFVAIELYSTADTTSTKHMQMTIHENSYYTIRTNNSLGMGGWVQYDREGIMVENISRIPLRESDYTLTYYYLDNDGVWQQVDKDNDTAYYKQGKAVIAPTESGEERGLYVSNNSGEWEKELNILGNSYTFVLRDKYGYTLEVEAELLNFDETAPSILYSMDSIAADNSAPLTITAYDSQSGIAETTLTHAGSEEVLSETSVDENGVYTYNKSLTSSGWYTIKVTDKVGNVERKVFSVSDIDTETPEIADISYNTTSLTSKAVTASIKYTKPNVTLTDITFVQDDFAYSANYSTSVIKFTENGTLNLTFEDAYGNVGYGTVGVSWIYTTPPSLEAVAEVADDCQSVDVTFVKATDDNGVPIDQKRELTDINIYYAGNVQRAQSVDDDGNVVDARYTFVKNGNYTFTVYDDEWLTSYITIAITGIDTEAPKVEQVLWTYNYDKLNESGEWETLAVKNEWMPSGEAGYKIFVDEDNPITKYDVDVTIVTDMEATIAGNTTSEASKEHTVTYEGNGSYIFNLKKPNGTVASYGFEVEVIDNTPPVIELTETELIFYENEQMNTPYSKDMIDKNFKAYDVFRSTITDLTDKVVIDYGNFDPTEITNNKYDRTKPYTITYTVTDSANNTTEAKLTVRLVALTDTIVFVNGSLPDSANRKYLKGTDEITVTLKNFSGTAYAKVAEGTLSMGKMKTEGIVIEETAEGEFTYKVSEPGWYTIMIQTDKRDYFNLQIAVQSIN